MGGTTFAARVAEYATAFDYASLPAEIVDWAKGVLLDTLGCAIAGFDSPPSQISRAVLGEMGGRPESTVIGTGNRLPCTAAAFANGTMVRYQDLNDTYLRAHAVGHFSEIIPTVLAVGERAGSSGVDVLAAIVLGYELLGCTTLQGKQATRGLQPYGSIAVPAVAGHLLGLDSGQITNAVGMALTTGAVLMSWFGGAGDMPMIKASVFSSTAQNGIFAALLASRGFTGPHDVVETYLDDLGLSRPYDLPAPGEFTVLDHNLVKARAAQVYTLAPIEGVLRLAREHRIRADEVEEVVVYGGDPLVELAATAASYRPATREAADHSAPYVVAMALLEGDVLPAQYERRQWEEGRVLSLMRRIRFVADSGDERRKEHPLGVRVEIRSRGSTHAVDVAAPRGHPQNPMPHAEIQEKFRRVVASRLDADAREAVVDLVDHVEEEPSLDRLMAALVLPPGAR